MFGIVLALSCLVSCLVSCSDRSDRAASEDATSTRPNVLLFVLDAARVDHFGVYGYERNTTPNIDGFAERTTRFTQAISEGSFTFASISSLFSGLPPDRTGLLKARRLGADLTLLGEVAREAGYRTRGYSENPYVTPALGFDRGFDDFDATLAYRDFKRRPRALQHTDASAGIDDMIEFMSTPSEKPFLAYVHLLRPHNPYAPPPDFAGRFGSRNSETEGSTQHLLALDRRKRPLPPGRLDNLRALYDENLAASDAMFGRLLEGITTASLLDDTVILLMSDHGEGFLEHDRLLHGSTTFDEMIRIPLLVWVPGAEAGVARHPIQLAHVGETLQAILAGAASPSSLLHPSESSPGETVSWTMQHERRACVRSAGRKLVVDPVTLKVAGYYDLEADPGETTSLPLDPLDDEGSRLLARMEARLRDGRFLAKPPTRAIDPELLEQMRALGYVEE